mmetsp:Transcript_22570/g.37249  ORF Transcript_22570/g.37249 Transcript_22570/m.37249 type:complete len:169 (-) Transcript_22570:2384-2890(-)
MGNIFGGHISTRGRYELMRHKVQRGETLWLISQKSGHSLRVIAQYNEIRDPRRLQIGQELILPYRVKKGDTLVKIARGFNTKANFIQHDNKIKDMNRILADQDLMIFDHSHERRLKRYNQDAAHAAEDPALSEGGEGTGTPGSPAQTSLTPPAPVSSNGTKSDPIVKR